MAAKGGRIPPDNRPAQAPGVGKQAKRHDLERQAVPNVSGSSDLQYGDRQMLEQAVGQAGQGKQVQPRSNPAARGQARPQRQPGTMQAPDPIEFMGSRFKGQNFGPPQGVAMTTMDISPWTPLMKEIANRPNAGGTLQQAFIRQMGNLMRRPLQPDLTMIDLNDLDAAVGVFLDEDGV